METGFSQGVLLRRGTIDPSFHRLHREEAHMNLWKCLVYKNQARFTAEDGTQIERAIVLGFHWRDSFYIVTAQKVRGCTWSLDAFRYSDGEVLEKMLASCPVMGVNNSIAWN